MRVTARNPELTPVLRRGSIAALAWLLVATACGAALPTDRGPLNVTTTPVPPAEDEAQPQADLLAPAWAALADGRPQQALELAAGAQRAGADRVQVVLLKAAIYA